MSSSSTTTAADPAGDLDAGRASIDDALREACDRWLPGIPARIGEAVRYSVLGEGKRLRGVLVLAAYRSAGGAGDARALAAAVEIVHAYSLVHDDLPCMDDDDVRRGRATTHRAHGVVTAMVAGLAMVPLAARALRDAAQTLGLPDDASARIVREVLAGAGAGGMIGGQLLDLEGEGRALSIGELEAVHRAKTGALITAAARIGGIAAGAPASAVDALGRYGDAIGLAFQIVDDLLDVTATTEQLGKTAGRDALLRKSTYPALLGVQGARARADALAADGVEALRGASLLTAELESIARYCVSRTR